MWGRCFRPSGSRMSLCRREGGILGSLVRWISGSKRVPYNGPESELYADNRVAGPSQYSAEDRKKFRVSGSVAGNERSITSVIPARGHRAKPWSSASRKLRRSRTNVIKDGRARSGDQVVRVQLSRALAVPGPSACFISLTTDLAEARADWKAGPIRLTAGRDQRGPVETKFECAIVCLALGSS